MSVLALRLIAENKAAYLRGDDATKLDLGNCGLTELPEELFGCVWLEELTLSNRYWNATIRGWEVSKNLGAPNNFNELPIQISNLINLEILRIGGDDRTKWNISDLSPIAGMTGLQSLYLSYNKITEVGFLRELTGLQSLDLPYNKITDVSVLRYLTSLKSLTISHNKLTDVGFVSTLTGLEYLDFSYNNLTDSGFLSELTELKFLDFSQNQLTDVGHLRGLVGLEFLYIPGNMLPDMNFLRELTGLNTLSLSNNQFTDLGPLRGLTRLQTLYISGDQPTDLDFLNELTGLQKLYLTGIQAIDVSHLRKLTGLQTLYLYGNQHTNLSFLSELTSLKSLSLRDSQLTDVDFLSELNGLEYLYLSGNQLTDLGFLRKLTGLKSLYLRDNKLSDVGLLHKLTKLQSLDLIGNKIKGIPLDLLEQLNLEIDLESESAGSGRISLKNNPIKDPLLGVLKQGRKFAIKYLKEKDKQPLNECKVIIIGRGGVGKTSLQKRLTNQAFDPQESQTNGIIKTNWKDGIKSWNNKSITVNFWDFGGQRMQEVIHQFFYSKDTIYIIVLDGRKDENPEDFLELIKTYGENSTVIIVYNNRIKIENNSASTVSASIKNYKNQETDYDLNYPLDSSLLNKYKIRKVFGICCALDDDKGILALRDYLRELVPTLDHVNEKYSKSWLALKNKLLDYIQDNYIEYEDYQTLCTKHGIKEIEFQKGLAKMLNSVGTVTFFDRPFIGNRYYILNPDWLTTGAYEIILSPITKEKRGRIKGGDLENIFDKKLPFEYTSQEYEFLLQLMEEFDLCHRFSKDEWLIPSSLEEKSKMDLVKFNDENTRQYCVKFATSLPYTVIHRFIARNIKYAYEDDYWPKGIVVKHPESATLMYVEADTQKKEIRLWIKGENIRDCWVFFRRDIREFSDKFEYQELVTIQQGVRVSYQDLMTCMKRGKTEWFVPALEEDINVKEILGLFVEEIDNDPIIDKIPPPITIKDTILNLIEKNKIYYAFKEMDNLSIKDHTLAQLREEFEKETQGVNFNQRLQSCVDRLFNDIVNSY